MKTIVVCLECSSAMRLYQWLGQCPACEKPGREALWQTVRPQTHLAESRVNADEKRAWFSAQKMRLERKVAEGGSGWGVWNASLCSGIALWDDQLWSCLPSERFPVSDSQAGFSCSYSAFNILAKIKKKKKSSRKQGATVKLGEEIWIWIFFRLKMGWEQEST